MLYFLVVCILNIAIPVNNTSPQVLQALRGLLTMGTLCVAIIVLISGIHGNEICTCMRATLCISYLNSDPSAAEKQKIPRV